MVKNNRYGGDIGMLKTEYGNFVDDPIKRLTAEEVYQEYLKNRNKQTDTYPTETDAEKIARLEQTVQELSDMLIMMSKQ